MAMFFFFLGLAVLVNFGMKVVRSNPQMAVGIGEMLMKRLMRK